MNEVGANRERGMVTVELAIGLLSLVLVLTGVLLALSVTATKGEVCQVARESVRAAALGASAPPFNLGVGREVTVDVGKDGALVTAVARAPSFVVGSWSAPGVSCRVTGMSEPYSWSGSR